MIWLILGLCCLVVVQVVLSACKAIAVGQTLVDRCGVEVITPEDLTEKPQILTQLLASGALRKL